MIDYLIALSPTTHNDYLRTQGKSTDERILVVRGTSSNQLKKYIILTSLSFSKSFCVLTPVIFYLFFTCMLVHAVQDLEEGVYLSGTVTAVPSLTSNAKTKTLQELIQEALFADDCSLVEHIRRETFVQWSFGIF